MRNSPWFPSHRPASEAELQLFCFPFAGGGASAFYPWRRDLPNWVDVWSVEYPGRETRFREPPMVCARRLADAISEEIAACIEMPFVLFGHSMGALLAFEVAQRLKNNYQLEPLELFVSGHSAPQLPPFRAPVRDLPEMQFRDELRRFGGTPEQVLNDEELMAFFSPILRKDMTVLETYQYTATAPLNFPITAFGGISDRTVPWHRLHDWAAQTSSRFSISLLPGDHFFIRAPEVKFPTLMRAHLERVVGKRPDEASLKDDEIVIWRVALDRLPEEVQALEKVLAADETQRAESYVEEQERTNFVVSRAALRMILAEMTGQPVEQIELDQNPQGKPIWRDGAASGELQFNLARAGSTALIAVAKGQALGVDIECVRPGLNFMKIAERVFSASERADLRKISSAQQLDAFFDAWVRREARSKCAARQFVGPPELVDFESPVEFASNECATSREAEQPVAIVQGFQPLPGYYAAVATERKCERMICFDWQPFTCESGLVRR
jgi:medium-chain acyl-[acyl-carrier-protein] hydrolase